jgi:hypothetical protein
LLRLARSKQEPSAASPITIIESNADIARTKFTVHALADRVAIQELTAQYNRAADGTDPKALLAVFAHDGSVEMRGRPGTDVVYRGDEIARLVAPAALQRVHMTMDAIIEVHGDRATQVCTVLLCTRAPGRGIGALLTGRYIDDLVRTPVGWRFRRRIAEIDFANEGRITLANATSGQG